METTNLCKLENSEQLPKEENIEKLANAFNIQVKDLFDFGHIQPYEYLQSKIIDIVKNASQQDIMLFYKIITAIREHN